MTRFSIVTPVFNPPAEVLAQCIRSVEDQTFHDWELCLVDDASTAAHVPGLLDDAVNRNQRITVGRRAENGGIVAASNDALALASGEFVVLLDHDDTLDPDALRLVDQCLRADEEIDVLYSDADKLDTDGHQVHPFVKPDWSPERFRHQNFLIHLAVMRRSIVSEVGGFRDGFDGAQDYDLLLRVTEHARRVHHLPRILYHWRMIPGSTAGNAQAKPAAYDAGRRAIADHCQRVGIAADVTKLTHLPGSYRVRRRIVRQPSVSIVVPTAGRARSLWGITTCLFTNAVRSVLERTDYPDYDIVAVYSQECDDEFRQRAQEQVGDRLIEVDQTPNFNFSDAINRGVAQSSGEFIVLLNDDIEIISPDWLDQFVAFLDEPDVGSVGPKLLLADFTIQSAGHWHGDTPEHLGRGRDRNEPGPWATLQIARECSSLSGSCLGVRRDVYERVGGLNRALPNAYNDADFGTKLRAVGLRNVWIPWVEMFHFEFSSRDPSVETTELVTYRERWRGRLRSEVYSPEGAW